MKDIIEVIKDSNDLIKIEVIYYILCVRLSIIHFKIKFFIGINLRISDINSPI